MFIRDVTFSSVPIVALLIIMLAGCSTQDQVSVADVELVKSLLTDTPQQSIMALDSVIKKQKYDGIQKGLMYFEQGKLWSKMHNSTKSIQSLESALEIFTSHEDKVYITKTHWLLGSENAYISNKEEAVEHLLKALSYSQELHNQTDEANTYSALAHTYFQYQDFNRSIEYTEKAIAIQKELQDSVGLSATYNNLAVIYRNIGNFPEAIEYNLRSLDLNLLLNDKNAIAKSYNNLGLLSEELGDVHEAVDYFLKAIKINYELGTLNENPLKNLGDLYLRTDDLENAQKYYEQALSISEQNEDLASQRDIYNILLNVALRQKDFERSIEYARLRDHYMRLQNKRDLQEKLELAENQYKLAAKEKELSLALEVNRREKIIFIVAIGLLLLLVLFWIQSVKNKKLQAEKEKMVLEQSVLRSQMNPHFIFNALSAIQNSLLDNKPIESATYLSRFARLIRQNFEFINKKYITLADEIELLKNYFSTQMIRFKDRFDYEINVDNLDEEDTEIPPMLLQPFAENAIEHGFKSKKEKGLIIINIKGEEERIIFEIIDNGIGFTPKENDGKTHSIDVFMKRLQLIGKGDERSVSINSSEAGTTVKFHLRR
ncbi:tetratricopeptide repeat protein [Fulvivirga maritima]|uniref:tetratricopeptide repeat-containing sensor histidine kinase n=1 Tax=Fulvivirga maritima TaxID=2904247 RepID=UPI001F3E36B7|nr:tetratricopeptide repeat protein [Fulvivirga maritima]UII28783.1 tetratricopeptide repeat protein [Fulvivirga maritima]